MSALPPISTPTTPYAQTAANAALVSGYGSTDAEQNVDAVSKDFESVFLSQMLGAMFSGDDLTNFFGGGTTGEVYKGYLLNEFGKAMAGAGGIGIAQVVKQELLKTQEVAA